MVQVKSKMKQDCPGIEARRQRLQNALWGLFIADALAMPAHWFYNINNIAKVFNGGIRNYVDPPHPHLESFMVGMGYHPDVETANRLGRSYDILHDHARFYHTNCKSEPPNGKTNTETWLPSWRSVIIITTV